MNKMRVGLAVVTAAVLGGGVVVHQRAEAGELPPFRFATVERANVRATVSATGALSALRTVQVGTQVSGQVSALYVDFNERVTKGQLLARIDPTLQQQGVQDAQAGVERSQAQLALARSNHERISALHAQRFVTDAEFSATQSAYAVAQADLKSADISLSRARQNLSYTYIYAPIEGVVVERNVDVGQTVAASLSAPQLFLIANSLTDMQILASVDESDIGRIAAGQPVTFTVQSYPTETFTGTVDQVRLGSTTTDNVVNYTAVVRVENAVGKLLPGMTATVKLVTASADSVLTVPNAALRFQPSSELLATQRAVPADSATRTSVGAAGGAARGNIGPSAGTPRTAAAGGVARPRAAVASLWTVDAAGVLTQHRVRTGLTDGQRTQLLSDVLAEGTEIIAGTADAGTTAAAPTTSNPLQPQQTAGTRRPPGAF